MKSEILSPKLLFQKNVHYVVPTFQRPYVWNQEDQWEPLWNDVRNTAERYMDELEKLGDDRRAEAENAVTPHFLGAVVLQQKPTATIEIEQRLVIDGQQRLTTLQLLLDAAQEVCEGLGLESEARRLSKLVLNDEDFADPATNQIFKIWPTNVDREAFRQAMHNDLPTVDFADSRIVLAHEFFQVQIGEWLTEPDAPIGRVAALETTLTGLLQMVVIDLDSLDDSHVIFETLNARGTPLIQSDLVKNYILYRAGEEGLVEDEVYLKYWRTLDDAWWREEVRQGRLVRPRVDVFLNYWLSMRTVADVQASRVFDMFGSYAEHKKIESIAADIKTIGETYRALDFVSDPDEAEFMYRWKVMDAGVVTPILLLLFSASPTQLPPARRKRALKAIESFLIRRMVCRLTTKDYNRLLLDMSERLQEKGIEFADEVIVEFLRDQTSNSREWPDDQMLQEAFLSLPLYRLLTRGRLRLVLEGIEQALRTSKAEQQNVPHNLTIEHLMPQGWQQHWPLSQGEADVEIAAVERSRLVHSIGNLTLVNEQLNPSLSNGPWIDKRKALGQHSVLFLNKAFLAESPADRWDETTIRKRGEDLARLAGSVWPGPSDWT